MSHIQSELRSKPMSWANHFVFSITVAQESRQAQ
jgi:hypothetical protein